MSPFQVLGITPGASRDELRRAWRRRALETHPDHGGDHAAFSLVHQAYAHLSAQAPTIDGRAPVLVRRMGVAALAVRWCRRRRNRSARSRVV